MQKTSKEPKMISTDEANQNTAVAVYKWMKLVQSIILVALGVIFIICAFIANGFEKTLSISMGVVFLAFGLIEVIAGYYLKRSLLAEDVLIGGLAMSFGIVLFLRGDFLGRIITLFMVILVFFYVAMLVLYGVDRLLGREPVRKNTTVAVLVFILAGLLAAADILFIVFKGNDKVMPYFEKAITILVGSAMVILGIISMVSLLIKVRNTKSMIRNAEIQKAEEESRRNENSSAEVKVVDLQSLKKQNKKSKKTEETTEKTTYVIDAEGKAIEDSTPIAIEGGKKD